MNLKIKRVYEPSDKSDGTRVLIDRLWPRGLTKAKAGVDVWLQNHPLMVPFQNWLTRVAARGRTDPNPFVVGAGEYQRFLDVMTGCSQVALERRKP